MEQLAKWLELSEENSKRVFGEELIYHIGKPNPLATQEKISKAEEKLFNKIAKEETKGTPFEFTQHNKVCSNLPCCPKW